MHAESLATKGLNNNDWSILFFIQVNEKASADELKTILSIPKYEVNESLQKMERMKIILQKENAFYSNVHK